jgi:hypothetical protein
MQGFEVSAARALNRALGRRGCVFADRYRPRALATRAAIRAVLRLRVFAAAPRVTWPATNLLIACLPRAFSGLPPPVRGRRRSPTTSYDDRGRSVR